MTLRAVNPYTSYRTLVDMQRNKALMANLSNQISSGNRLTSLTDDPTASALVLGFQDSIERNSTYIDQANSATSFLKSTETSLDSINNALTRMLEIGQQGLSENTGAQGRASIAQEVDGLRTNIIDLSNTQSQGKYLFAGAQTLTKPFSGPSSGPIAYAGDSASIDLDVSSSSTISTNLTGDKVFFGASGQGSATDIFQQVSDLRDGLNSNNTAMIQQAYDNLKAIQGTINNQITDVGGRQAQLSSLTTSLTDYNQTLQTIQSSYQSVDYPTAITNYSEAQISEQATLSMLGKTSSQNLFNYLT